MLGTRISIYLSEGLISDGLQKSQHFNLNFKTSAAWQSVTAGNQNCYQITNRINRKIEFQNWIPPDRGPHADNWIENSFFPM